MNTKNITLFLGVCFGIAIYFCDFYVLPCFMLLIIAAIQTFEMTNKKKRMIEEHLDHKLKIYEEERDLLKKDFDKVKSDLENYKNRLNVSQMYGTK